MRKYLLFILFPLVSFAIGRKDINYRQIITLTKKDNSVETVNQFKGKCRIVESN